MPQSAIESMPAGLYPFWFWNDRLTEREIRWQIREMADKGIRGFFIHPRQGLEQPYLSEAFFQMVAAAVDEAEQRGLVVHLYDEYPYPSGAAGGEVTLGEPRFLATSLEHQAFDVQGGPVRLDLAKGKTLSAKAFPLRGDAVDWSGETDLMDSVGVRYVTEAYTQGGLTSYNRKRYWANQPTPSLETTLPAGRWRVHVSTQTIVDGHKYFGSFADVMNPEAVRRFIELTHERYRERFGDKFGKTILSIFVDETAPRWSELVPPRFLEQYGYDILQAMPALQDDSHPDHVKVAIDMKRLTLEMFCESFDGQVSRWCREHGLAYSSEKNTVRLSQFRLMDIPGGDSGHTKVGAPMDLTRSFLRQNMRAVASAAYFYEKPGALCECYHSLGWSGTIQDAKLMADGLLLMGIPWLVPHGFFYTTHALKKHDAPPTFFFQQPYWPLFGKLSERVDAIGRAFEGTRIDARILVVDPSIGNVGDKFGKRADPVQAVLLQNHLDYLIVDTDILEAARIRDGRVHARDIVADVVIVPHMDVVEEPLREWLVRYESAGGKTVYCDDPLDHEALERAVLPLVGPSLSVRSEGSEIPDVQVVKRVSRDRTLWFIVNVGGETWNAELDAGQPLREIPLDPDMPQLLESADQTYKRAIAPFEGFLLEAAEDAAPMRPPTMVRIPVHGRARIRTRDKNLLRMYEWSMSILDEQGAPSESALVPAVPLANQLQISRLRFSPDIKVRAGGAALFEMPELRVRYEHSFQVRYSGRVELVMEPGSIKGDWRISVNDAPRLTACDFTETDAHVRGSLAADVTPLLRPGANSMAVEVVAHRPDDGLLNALYLAGDFGVKLDPPTLVEPVAEAAFEDYLGALLPYYAGVIEYSTEFTLDRVPDGEWVVAELEYPAPFHEATEVSVNGGDFLPALWSPRRIKLRADQLKPGANMVTTRVYTTLIRSFEGRWFDYNRHEDRDVADTDPAP